MMKVHKEEITIPTGREIELINLTEQVNLVARRSGVKEGVCLVYSPHTTAAVVINENEEGLMRDIISKVSRDFPRGIGWQHDKIDHNAHSHLAATYLGPSKFVPVSEGELKLGTWQSIFLLELDGPRTRSLIVQVMGDD